MNLTLTQWIDAQGGNTAAAKLLNENPRTVGSWYRLERAPGFKAALNIYVVSKHVVDFNGIYCPLAKRALEQGE